MSDKPSAQPGTPPAEGAAGPRLRVIGQYVHDLSFENPHGPTVTADPEQKPQVEVTVNVETRRGGDQPNRYEVLLKINAVAKRTAETAFLLELDYRGMFEVAGFPDNLLGQVLLVECPRLLFPYARKIASDTVQDGGFPAFMLDPIDFLALYRARLAQEAQKGKANPPGQPTTPVTEA